jgi:hypothetical protein
VKVLADAEATRIKLTAEADARKEARVGMGKAIAIEEQVRAYGGPQLQLIQDVMGKLATAIQSAGIPIVPSTYVEMGGGGKDSENTAGGGANAFNLLMTLLSTEHLKSAGVTLAEQDPEHAEAVRLMKASLRDSLAVPAPESEAQKEARPKASVKPAPAAQTPPAGTDPASQPGSETKN